MKVNKSTATVSTTISLLSTLCRGSEAITHNLLRSNLAEAIESALQGDERCTLDTMRLIDLLLVLLFEGKFFFCFLSVMSLRRTSKDSNLSSSLPSFSMETKS